MPQTDSRALSTPGRLTLSGAFFETLSARYSERSRFTSGEPRYPELPVTRTSGCCVAMQTPSWENVQIHDRHVPAARDGPGASCLAGSAGLDLSAADPGTALAQVWGEAWGREAAPAQEMAPVVLGSCPPSSMQDRLRFQRGAEMESESKPAAAEPAVGPRLRGSTSVGC